MRDLLNDLSEGLSHPDPIRRAQIQMKKPLPKRFYTGVSVAEHEGGFAITLDGKMVRTPKHGRFSPCRQRRSRSLSLPNGRRRARRSIP